MLSASIKHKKQPVVIHPENWNSRFWIEKIPEYKVRSSLSSHQNKKLRKSSNHLPKISSNQESDSLSVINKSDSGIKSSLYKDLPRVLNQSKPLIKHTPQLTPTTFVQKYNKINLTPSHRRPLSKKSEKPTQNSSKTAEQEISKGPEQKILQTNPVLPPLSQTTEKDQAADLENPQKSDQLIPPLLPSVHSSLLSEFINETLLKISKEAVDEALLAYLKLSSNKILYVYINEALDEMIPSIAKAAYNESKEKHPSEIRDEIAAEVNEEEIIKIVKQFTVNILANQVAGEYAQMVEFRGYILECIQDVEKDNKDKIEKIFHYLIDNIVEEEWVEILAEDTINSMRIENNWSLLPENLQKEIWLKQKSRFLVFICDRIYTEMLNEIVGIWVQAICRECVEGFSEDVMTIPKYQTRKMTLRNDI